MCGGNTILSSPELVFPFPTFPGGVENAYSQFFRKLFDLFEIFFADYDQDTRGLQELCGVNGNCRPT